MLTSTTHSIEGRPVKSYLGVVTGETIIGANFVKDFMASLTDFFGGRSTAYEKALQEARTSAVQEMNQHASAIGANAVIGIDFDYETVGKGMLMVCVSGTAVILEG